MFQLSISLESKCKNQQTHDVVNHQSGLWIP